MNNMVKTGKTLSKDYSQKGKSKMTAITDCLKQININSTLASENVSVWEFHNVAHSDMQNGEDDEEEIFGPSMVFMAHAEEVAGM